MVERVGCETCAHREEKDLSVNQPAIHCDDCSSHRDRWESAAKDARIKELEAECNVLGNSLATRMERERGLLEPPLTEVRGGSRCTGNRKTA
jgi:hypothetical protein